MSAITNFKRGICICFVLISSILFLNLLFDNSLKNSVDDFSAYLFDSKTFFLQFVANVHHLVATTVGYKQPAVTYVIFMEAGSRKSIVI